MITNNYTSLYGFMNRWSSVLLIGISLIYGAFAADNSTTNEQIAAMLCRNKTTEVEFTVDLEARQLSWRPSQQISEAPVPISISEETQSSGHMYRILGGRYDATITIVGPHTARATILLTEPSTVPTEAPKQTSYEMTCLTKSRAFQLDLIERVVTAARNGNTDELTRLLAILPLNINALSQSGSTALTAVIESRSLEALNALLFLRNDIDPNITNKQGASPMQLAINANAVEMAVFLNEYSPKLDLSTLNLGRTCDLTIINTLLRSHPEIPVNYSIDQATPLLSQLLPCQNSVELITSLLTLRPDIDVNIRDKQNGATPLIQAAATYNRADLILRLLELRTDTDINAVDNSGQSALMKLARHFDRRLIDVQIKFLQNRSDLNVNQVDANGNTALHLLLSNTFAQQREAEVVKMLPLLDAYLGRTDLDRNLLNAEMLSPFGVYWKNFVYSSPPQQVVAFMRSRGMKDPAEVYESFCNDDVARAFKLALDPQYSFGVDSPTDYSRFGSCLVRHIDVLTQVIKSISSQISGTFLFNFLSKFVYPDHPEWIIPILKARPVSLPPLFKFDANLPASPLEEYLLIWAAQTNQIEMFSELLDIFPNLRGDTPGNWPDIEKIPGSDWPQFVQQNGGKTAYGVAIQNNHPAVLKLLTSKRPNLAWNSDQLNRRECARGSTKDCQTFYSKPLELALESGADGAIDTFNELLNWPGTSLAVQGPAALGVAIEGRRLNIAANLVQNPTLPTTESVYAVLDHSKNYRGIRDTYPIDGHFLSVLDTLLKRGDFVPDPKRRVVYDEGLNCLHVLWPQREVLILLHQYKYEVTRDKCTYAIQKR